MEIKGASSQGDVNGDGEVIESQLLCFATVIHLALIIAAAWPHGASDIHRQ